MQLLSLMRNRTVLSFNRHLKSPLPFQQIRFLSDKADNKVNEESDNSKVKCSGNCKGCCAGINVDKVLHNNKKLEEEKLKEEKLKEELDDIDKLKAVANALLICSATPLVIVGIGFIMECLGPGSIITTPMAIGLLLRAYVLHKENKLKKTNKNDN